MSEEIVVLESETGAGLFKREEVDEEPFKRTVLNNRGRKWFRDQLGITAVISGIGLIAGISTEYWLGLNLISLPITVYHAKKEYEPLKEKFRDDE